MLLGSIAGPGATEFLEMIQRNYPLGYMSSIFTSASNYLFKVTIDSDGIAKALFHLQTTYNVQYSRYRNARYDY